jgi:hypothetical protein
MTLLICFGVFFVGFTHPYLFGGPDQTPVLRAIGWLAPNLHLFDPQDPLTFEKPIPMSYLVKAVAYCAAYAAALLAIGVALFQTRQLEAETGGGAMPGAVVVLSWAGRAGSLLLAVSGLTILSVGEGQTVRSVAVAGGLLAAAVVTWLFWGWFARGLRWSYWTALAAAVAVLGIHGATILSGGSVQASTFALTAQQLTLAALAAAFVLLILILPRTRRHFAGQRAGR